MMARSIFRSGRLVSLAILVVTALFGLGVWYATTRAYYEPLQMATIDLSRPDGSAIPLTPTGFVGIDAETSPLRFRACFALDEADTSAALAEAMPYDDPTPLVAPGWFDCYDAGTIVAALEAGEAEAVLGSRNIVRGVDRVVAIFPDGRAYAWHQLNGTLE